MTDQTRPSGQPAAEPPPAQEPPPSEAASPPPPPPTFEQRMEDLGRRAEDAGQRLGREAQAAGERWSRDPGVVRAADTATRFWGLVVLAVGLWFFADVTVGMDMPEIAWRDAWPLALILLGLFIVVRGATRRRA